MTTSLRTPSALVFAALLALAGCGERDDPASTSGATTATPSATTTMPPASDPASAPAR